MALMTHMDRLITFLENDEHVIGIFLDLSKAYDTSIHVMLLKSIMVLETMPLNGLKVISAIANNMWLKMKYYQLKKLSSAPQGSIPGPLVFLVDINDLC